jgi:hypothetical protein
MAKDKKHKRKVKDAEVDMGGKDTKRSKGRASGPAQLGKSDYLERLGELEISLNNMARWLQATG